MATYNGSLRTLSRTYGLWDAAHLLCSMIDLYSAFVGDKQNAAAYSADFELGNTSSVLEVTNKPIFNARKRVLNRGRNTGSGPTFVYWYSPDVPDPTGVYYNLQTIVPWSQVTDVIWASTVPLRTTWPPTTA